MSSNAAEAQNDEAWLRSAVGATTLGELEQVVRDAQAAGAFDARDLAWCRALWTALGPGGHWAAIALVRRELGGTVLEAAS